MWLLLSTFSNLLLAQRNQQVEINSALALNFLFHSRVIEPDSWSQYSLYHRNKSWRHTVPPKVEKGRDEWGLSKLQREREYKKRCVGSFPLVNTWLGHWQKHTHTPAHTHRPLYHRADLCSGKLERANYELQSFKRRISLSTVYRMPITQLYRENRVGLLYIYIQYFVFFHTFQNKPKLHFPKCSVIYVDEQTVYLIRL